MNVKIFTCAHVPPSLEQKWLQHLRDFDTANPGCHFEVGVDGPEETVATMVKRLQVEPGLTTGAVRGLLCSLCNLTLGNVRDNPDILRAMIAYLKK